MTVIIDIRDEKALAAPNPGTEEQLRFLRRSSKHALYRDQRLEDCKGMGERVAQEVFAKYVAAKTATPEAQQAQPDPGNQNQ